MHITESSNRQHVILGDIIAYYLIIQALIGTQKTIQLCMQFH